MAPGPPHRPDHGPARRRNSGSNSVFCVTVSRKQHRHYKVLPARPRSVSPTPRIERSAHPRHRRSWCSAACICEAARSAAGPIYIPPHHTQRQSLTIVDHQPSTIHCRRASHHTHTSRLIHPSRSASTIHPPIERLRTRSLSLHEYNLQYAKRTNSPSEGPRRRPPSAPPSPAVGPGRARALRRLFHTVPMPFPSTASREARDGLFTGRT